MDFLVLVECKHHKNPIKREHVQVLRDKVIALGAQKGMLFSTSDFQKGAVQYAVEHGIALIRIAPGETSYFARSASRTKLPDGIPAYVGWFISKKREENAPITYSVISVERPDALRSFLLEPANARVPDKTAVG